MKAKVSAAVQEIAADAVLADSAEIVAERVFIGPGSIIKTDVTIRAKEVYIGYKTVIEQRCTIGAIGGSADRISVGDYSFIGHDTTILVPTFIIGDYSSVHNHVLVNGYEPCRLGHNCFVGQHSVLNATEELTIGNNFRMALNGYIWTHAESGELLEGCTFYHRRPTVIEDNVWLAGCNISISPGVRLGNGSIILMGSVVTRDTVPRHCYGGVPARDLTEKLRPYRAVSGEEKVAMMKRFVQEFIELHGVQYAESFAFVPDVGTKLDNPDASIVIVERGAPVSLGDGVSVFSLSEKSYIKQRTELEERFMRFLVGARARFLPHSLVGSPKVHKSGSI